MKLVPNAVKGALGRHSLKLDKASPNLLFGLGVGGMVLSTALACRATLKMSEVMETAKNDLTIAKSLDYSESTEANAQQRDIAIIHGRAAIASVKLYAPSVALGAASIACLTKSHNLLQGRNLALTAAYAAVDEAFTAYRDRVVTKYGEDVDRELRYDVRDVEYKQIGTDKIVKGRRVGPGGESMYARFFDQTSPSWSKDPEYNNTFLICQQNWFNDLLKVRGHVFLNEVYDGLGIPRTRAGQVVGWMISRDGSSDNYIDFGIFDGESQVARDFMNGREGAILLDFNVDGTIYDKIDPDSEDIKPWQR